MQQPRDRGDGLNRTVGAGRKGVAVFPRSAGIRRVRRAGAGAGVVGATGLTGSVAVRHLGAELEPDLLSTPPPPLLLSFLGSGWERGTGRVTLKCNDFNSLRVPEGIKWKRWLCFFFCL